MKRRIGPLAAVLLAVAACSSSAPAGGSATPDPSIAFCAALDAYTKTLVTLQALDSSSTVDQYKTAGGDAKAALAVLVTAAAPLAGAQVIELKTAQGQLDTAVSALPPNATAAQADVVLDPFIANVIKEAGAQRNATCNTRPTASSAS